MQTYNTQQTFDDALKIIANVQEDEKEFDTILFLLRLASINPEALVKSYRASLRINAEDGIKDGFLGTRVKALLREGKKIQAIKLYREETGAWLLGSKNAVEEIAREIGL